ncbi:hypothetical protein ABIE26_000289 [Pedobacter africanus]|uniref:Uncharacterized protein n=1 Tax=Pedobacter africanus TaxID=151894 RepID=A0ACC6KV31_9SPHI|nr:hypothetical protein [Pedobacter africanus]MDR6783223.1 hypothetical protein [Pedobacter africanus]
MKNKILLMIFSFFFISVAQAQDPKKMTISEFEKLDSISRVRYLDGFAKALSVDTNFVNMQHTSLKVQGYMLQMRKGKVDTTVKGINRGNDLNYYKDKGVSDPDNFIKSRKMMIFYTSKLVSTYPTYGKLDRESMRVLLRKAKKLIK